MVQYTGKEKENGGEAIIIYQDVITSRIFSSRQVIINGSAGKKRYKENITRVKTTFCLYVVFVFLSLFRLSVEYKYKLPETSSSRL